MMQRMTFWIAILLLAGAATLVLLGGCTGKRPASVGRFAACPDSPNCVSTKAPDATHRIEPIRYTGSKAEAKQKLLAVLASFPRAQTITEEEDFIHVEFTSRILRFVDDVEFYLGEEEGVLHFRSASRLGRSDLGANRRRMETLREKFAAAENPQ